LTFRRTLLAFLRLLPLVVLQSPIVSKPAVPYFDDFGTDRVDQVSVVADEHDRTFELPQRLSQDFARIHVQWLVGSSSRSSPAGSISIRAKASRAFPTGKHAHLLGDVVLSEEEGPRYERTSAMRPAAGHLFHGLEDRLVRVEHLQLVLAKYSRRTLCPVSGFRSRVR